MSLPVASSLTTSHSGSRWLLPVLVFAVLVACTLTAWRWQLQAQNEALESAGLHDSAAHTAELRDRLKLHAQFLRTLSAFATANVAQDLNAWERYTNEIDIRRNLNGLYAFAYAPAIAPEQRDAFIKEVRRKPHRHNFAIYPAPNSQLVAPIVFIAPATSELQAALGFNMLSESTRRDAIETAVASNDIAMSGRITLVTDTKSQGTSFQLYYPVFRPGMPIGTMAQRQKAFAGLVLLAYHTEDFLALLNLGFNSQFAVRIYDEGSNSRQATPLPPVLLFDSAPDFHARADTPVFHHEIDFGGRNWVLHYHLRQHGTETSGLDAASLILVGGLAGSALLSLLVFYLTTHRQRAEVFARQLTAELRHSEERMRLATAGTNDGLWDQDLLTGEDYISDRMAEIFGFPLDAPRRMSLYAACTHPEDVERRRACLRRHLRENPPLDIEIRIRKADGNRAWIRIRGEAVRNRAGRAIRIAGSVSDITERKSSEARLERMHRLLTTSIAATPLPVFVQDEKRKLQMVNTAFCELLHATERELLTGFWPDFPGIDAEARRRLIGGSERAISGSHCEPLEFLFVPPGEAPRHLIIRIAQAQNPEGQPFLIATLTDVSELRQAENAIKAANDMKQAVLDASTEVSIIATDPDGLITIFNRGAEKLLGYAADEMVGRQTPLCIHLREEIEARARELSLAQGRPVAGFDTFVIQPRHGRPEQHDWTYVRKDGERITVNLVTTAQRDASGKISGYLGIAIDISEQKRIEHELALHRDHLQELVTERTQRLDVALREAQAANVAKSEFLANMSHELRTPMHAILSFSELGEDRAKHAGEDKTSLYFNRIGQSARRLLGLINDLLDLAKLEAGRMEISPEPIDMLGLLRQSGSHLESLMAPRHLALRIGGETSVPRLYGDPRQIAQVIHNLLSNAIKFSPDGGVISVDLMNRELDSGAALAIRFCDQGVGIPENELESIFDKFVQSSATKTGAGGTGLGLAICREIVQQHRGRIVAENAAEGGACFTVILPLNIWNGPVGPHV